MESGFVRAALARGDVAFGAFDGDQLIAYVWRPFGAAPDADGLWVKVDPPHHYAYKAFTLPAYRASASTSPFRSFPTTIFWSADTPPKSGSARSPTSPASPRPISWEGEGLDSPVM